MLGQQLLKLLDYGSLDYLNIFSLKAALSVQHCSEGSEFISSLEEYLKFYEKFSNIFFVLPGNDISSPGFFYRLVANVPPQLQIGLRGIIWVTVSGRANFTPA